MSGIAEKVGVEVATKAVVWIGGAAVVLFVLPKVLPWVARQVAGGVGSASNAAGRVVGSAASVVSPTNPENVFYGLVNGVGQGITGRDSFTLGGWLYDLTHPEDPGPAVVQLPPAAPVRKPQPVATTPAETVWQRIAAAFPGFGAM